MKNITELRTDFEDNGVIHFDAYFTDNDNEEGKVIATYNKNNNEVHIKDMDYHQDTLFIEELATVLTDNGFDVIPEYLKYVLQYVKMNNNNNKEAKFNPVING